MCCSHFPRDEGAPQAQTTIRFRGITMLAALLVTTPATRFSQAAVMGRDVEDNLSIGLLFPPGTFRRLDLADLDSPQPGAGLRRELDRRCGCVPRERVRPIQGDCSGADRRRSPPGGDFGQGRAERRRSANMAASARDSWPGRHLAGPLPGRWNEGHQSACRFHRQARSSR